MTATLSSRRHPKVQRWREWIHKPAMRRASDWALVEGEHLIRAAWEAGVAIREVWCTHEATERYADLLALLQQRSVPLIPVTREVIAAVSDTETPPGLVAEVSLPRWPAPRWAESDLVLVDGVQEPGNVGAILRVAAAAGLCGVWLMPGCAHAWSPKVLRAAQGAHFVLPVWEGEPVEAVWQTHVQRGRLVALALAGNAVSLFEQDWRAPTAWIVGSEAHGVSGQWLARASRIVRIPMPGAMESLNVASALAVALFEQVRQRQAKALPQRLPLSGQKRR